MLEFSWVEKTVNFSAEQMVVLRDVNDSAASTAGGSVAWKVAKTAALLDFESAAMWGCGLALT
jgi:hypothetical protein